MSRPGDREMIQDPQSDPKATKERESQSPGAVATTAGVSQDEV